MKKLENLLYSNVGKKIKMLALITGIIGMLAVIVGLILLLVGCGGEDDLLIVGPIVAGSGLVLWVSTWPLYAFGQITEDVHNGVGKGTSKPEKLPEL